MKTISAISSVLLLTAVACLGGQTGDPSGRSDDEGGNTGGGQCDEVLHPIGSVDETTPLGFSAAQVLEFAAGQFESSIAWGTPSNVTFGPESGMSDLTMTVTYDGGPAYFVESTPKDDGLESGGLSIGFGGCNNSLRIDVTVSVHTAGGALAETFVTTLEAGSLYSAAFAEPLDPAALSGSFEILGVDPPEGQIKQFGLNATLTPFGFTGTLTSILEVRIPGPPGDPNGGAVGASWVTYATFPGSAACASDNGDTSGFAMPPTNTISGFSGAQMIEQWSAATPVEVAWLDGTTTELTLAATPTGDGCVRLGAWYGTEPFRASYPVQITATTADGRLDGEYVGKIDVVPDAEGNVQTIFGSASLPLELEQAAQSGFSELGDVSRYQRLFFALDTRIDGSESKCHAVLNGLIDPPCLTIPPPPDPGGMGAPGCTGTEVTPIERAQWGEPDE